MNAHHQAPTMSAELVLDARAVVGEGPVWDARTRELFWVDVVGQSVRRFDPVTGRDDISRFDQMVGAVAPRASGGLVMAAQHGFATLDRFGADLTPIADVAADDPDIRMNDGGCDPAGRFYAGTMSISGRRGAGVLCRLDPDGSVTTVLDAVSISNGVDWSPDGSVMYYVDTPTGAIDVFDYQAATGAMTHRRRLAEIAAGEGVPDGLAVDRDGFVWVALWGGWQVRRYSPDGALDRVVSLPVSQVTSCCFGGPGLDELYITSARFQLTEEQLRQQPYAGALFRCEPGVVGQPARSFQG